MRLPRMTTRRWMLAILALSIPISATRTWINLKDRSERAQYHRRAITAGLGGGCNDCFRSLPRDPVFLVIFYWKSEPKKLWHARMARKYELAALRPWLPVGPDTPSP